HILSSLPRLFRGNEKYENLTRPQSIEQICDSESLNLGIIKTKRIAFSDCCRDEPKGNKKLTDGIISAIRFLQFSSLWVW
ncbi:MAG: hypothetical protein PF517_05125, partial [Salinivirgaceae bacterium]|nr:hypothetical protein [Salinivirgaceae bacterium]